MRYLFATITGLLLIITSVILFILFTHTGLNISISLAKKLMPGQLEIEVTEGTLATKILLKKIHYQHAGVNVNIQELALAWHPLPLLFRQLLIDKLYINDLQLHFLTPKNKPLTTSQKIWITRFNINNLEISKIKLYRDNILTTYINKIILFTPHEKMHQFGIQFPKGIILGHYSLEFTPYLTWNLVANGINVDTNHVWANSNSEISFHLNSTGIWRQNNQRYSLNLSNLMGNIHQQPLAGQIKLSYDDGNIIIENIDLALANAFVKAQGNAGKKWNIVWHINMPNLKLIDSTLNGKILSNGTIVTQNKIPLLSGNIYAQQLQLGQFSLASLNAVFSSALNYQTAQLKLIAHHVKFSDITLPALQLLANSAISSTAILTTIDASFSPLNKIQAKIQIPNLFTYRATGNTLSGQIAVTLQDISHLINSPLVKSPRGTIQAHITLDGTLAKPTFRGYVDLKNGQLSIPKLGITPHAIQIHSSFNQLMAMNVTGSFVSGNGNGSVKGTVTIQENLQAHLSITGNELQVANTKEYKMRISPQLTLITQGVNTTINGNIFIPYIHVVKRGDYNVVTLPDELEFAGEKKNAPVFNNLALRLQLTLGNDAFIHYQDLQANLMGSIAVYKLNGGLPSGNGDLIIKKGTYRVYDKIFVIDEGRLIYRGNLLTNPGLSIRAMKQASFPTTNLFGFHMSSDTDSMKVGVSIGGTLARPSLTLIGQPPMNQDDILSNLVFGQSRANVSGLDALSLLGSLTDKMNITDPNLGAESNMNGGFLGVFKMGIFNPAQALNLNAPISKHWKLQTETSINEIAVDLLYVYERE